MDEVWRRIEAWLAAHAPAIAAGLNPPASAGEIDETERFLGVRLPDDVRASYLRHDGQSQDSPWMMNGWEWLSLTRIRDEWKVWKDVLDSGAFAAIESDADGVSVRRDWWNPAWIPVTYSGCGDHHCLDLAPGPRGISGQVIEMWHDEGARPVVADGFGAWLSQFADDLEAGELVFSDDLGGLYRVDDV
ncbi:MAG TPA: SMI1/KNR4 family protein [Longimicrobium sp.]|jgi:cell wall assembly regulator SMI1